MNERALADDIARIARAFAVKLREVAARIPFAVQAAAMYYALLDPKTPLKVKATAAAALLYFIAPLDAITDLLPFAGYTDDAAVLFAAYRTIQAYVTDEHVAAAKRLLDIE